jgi:hypothetical protein
MTTARPNRDRVFLATKGFEVEAYEVEHGPGRRPVRGLPRDSTGSAPPTNTP